MVFTFFINGSWDGFMCVDWIELFVRIFLITRHLKIHFSWKAVLHRTLYIILIFQKNYIWHLAKILITHSTVNHKQYLNDVVMRTVRYSYILSIVGTNIFFSESVNRIKRHCTFPSKSHCYGQDNLQHSNNCTSAPFSHPKLHLTNGLFLLKACPCVDALRYLNVYRISTVYILVSDEGEIGVQVDLFIII
jgi:hypothetical protein